MDILLEPHETIKAGGRGVLGLLKLGLKDLMVRWVNYMLDQAQIKLKPILEILEREVDLPTDDPPSRSRVKDIE